MPSLAVTVPQYTRNTDLIDATDREYRQLSSVLAGCQMALQASRQLQNIHPTTGVVQATKYFMPGNVSDAQRPVYELLVNALVGAPVAIAGTRTSDTVFTPTTSPVWPVNGLAGLWVYSFVVDDGDTVGTWLPVASNTATAVTITGVLHASATGIYVTAAPAGQTGLSAVLATLNAIMAL